MDDQQVRSGVVDWEADNPNAYEWTRKAFEMMTADSPTLRAKLTSSDGVLSCAVTGMCPRCADLIPQTIVLSAVTHSGKPGDEEAVIGSNAAVTPVIVSCSCGGTHKGRPDGTTAGCGINFKLLLPLEN